MVRFEEFTEFRLWIQTISHRHLAALIIPNRDSLKAPVHLAMHIKRLFSFFRWMTHALSSTACRKYETRIQFSRNQREQLPTVRWYISMHQFTNSSNLCETKWKHSGRICISKCAIRKFLRHRLSAEGGKRWNLANLVENEWCWNVQYSEGNVYPNHL